LKKQKIIGIIEGEIGDISLRETITEQVKNSTFLENLNKNKIKNR
jgi:hypothetical protein